MSKVGKSIAKLLNPGVERAQALQEKQIRDEKARLAAVEAGQRRVTNAGTFMGYIEEALKDKLG